MNFIKNIFGTDITPTSLCQKWYIFFKKLGFPIEYIGSNELEVNFTNIKYRFIIHKDCFWKNKGDHKNIVNINKNMYKNITYVIFLGDQLGVEKYDSKSCPGLIVGVSSGISYYSFLSCPKSNKIFITYGCPYCNNEIKNVKISEEQYGLIVEASNISNIEIHNKQMFDKWYIMPKDLPIINKTDGNYIYVLKYNKYEHTYLIGTCSNISDLIWNIVDQFGLEIRLIEHFEDQIKVKEIIDNVYLYNSAFNGWIWGIDITSIVCYIK